MYALCQYPSASPRSIVPSRFHPFFDVQTVVVFVWPAALNFQRKFTNAILRPHGVGIRESSGQSFQFPEIETVFEGSPVVDGGKVGGLTPADIAPVLRKGDGVNCLSPALEPRQDVTIAGAPQQDFLVIAPAASQIASAGVKGGGDDQVVMTAEK